MKFNYIKSNHALFHARERGSPVKSKPSVQPHKNLSQGVDIFNPHTGSGVFLRPRKDVMVNIPTLSKITQ